MNDQEIMELVEDELRDQSLFIRIETHSAELYSDLHLNDAIENLKKALTGWASVRILESDELKRRGILPNAWPCDRSLIALSAT